MSLAVSLQHRLDALRKKCSTGYGCGSACISLRKECRTTPRSAIGKERMKRLLELAAGGASSQRGIAQVRQQEAGELAGAIATRRGEKAGQLKGTRQQAAAEKAQAAEAAAKASTSSKAPAFDELMSAVGANTFGGRKRRTDSRDERIQRLVQEAYQAAVADRRAHARKLQQRIDALRASCTPLNG